MEPLNFNKIRVYWDSFPPKGTGIGHILLVNIKDKFPGRRSPPVVLPLGLVNARSGGRGSTPVYYIVICVFIDKKSCSMPVKSSLPEDADEAICAK